MTTATINHIVIDDDDGVARIGGTRIKVMHLVIEKMANGWDPEQMQRQFAHLSLAQIHSAFAYYYDHQPEIDAQIRRSVEEAQAMRAAGGESPVVERLRNAGKLL